MCFRAGNLLLRRYASDREPRLVEPGDEVGLAEVRFAQSREAPRERRGLVLALREFLQVPEQGDGGVVLGWHPGADQPFGVGPGRLRVLGQFVKVPLPGGRTLLFTEGLPGGGHCRGMLFVLQTACRGRVEELGDGPPGLGGPLLIWVCAEAP